MSPCRFGHGAGLNNWRDYCRVLDFIYRRCSELNGAFTRAFLTGERRLPEQVNVAIDSQSLMVSWPQSHSCVPTRFMPEPLSAAR